MNLQELLSDKNLKTKEKTEALSKWLLANPNQLDELINFSKSSKDPVKATCIEAIEYATKKDPKIATANCLKYVTETLKEKAPRIKWESAKVIGNIAQLYPKQLDEAVVNLLGNTEHTGTVVRWAAAFALGQIVQLKTAHTKELIPAIEAICKREEKNSIKKIYSDALKKIKS